MQSRYIFDKVNQDIVASIAKQLADTPEPSCRPTSDDLVCAVIFIVLIAFLVLL